MRSTRKLVLSKETLRELTGPELRRVAGAVREVCEIDTKCKNGETSNCSGGAGCGPTGGCGGTAITCDTCDNRFTCFGDTCDSTCQGVTCGATCDGTCGTCFAC